MGVPVLSLRGGRHAGRMMVASVLTEVGLKESLANTPEEFVARAAALAEDRGRLAGLRSALRERVGQSPLCDGAAFTRRREAAYRAPWRRRAWGEGPAGRTAASPSPPGPPVSTGAAAPRGNRRRRWSRSPGDRSAPSAGRRRTMSLTNNSARRANLPRGITPLR
jgi:hypothetical protein